MTWTTKTSLSVGHPYTFLLNCTHISVAVVLRTRTQGKIAPALSHRTPLSKVQYWGLHDLHSALNSGLSKDAFSGSP